MDPRLSENSNVVSRSISPLPGPQLLSDAGPGSGQLHGLQTLKGPVRDLDRSTLASGDEGTGTNCLHTR